VTDALNELLDEVRAHLAWEAARGHVGIAYEPPARGGQRAAPVASSSVVSQAPRPQQGAPAQSAPERSSGMPDEARAFINQLKGSRAGPVPGQKIDRGIVASPVAEPAPAVTAPAPIVSGPRPPGDRARLPILAKEITTCTKCRLHEGRTQTVFARGNPSAPVLFVGEGPGYNEDKQGEPFVGAAGELLDKMIEAMGLGADGVYICNVVKCRPPENRTPLPDEAAACMPYLREQIASVAPRIIVALGRCAAENLGCALPGRSWRGTWGTFDTIPVMPTYHPAYLLRSPEMKRPVWEDLQKVMQRIKA
jgi:DNA polymerase